MKAKWVENIFVGALLLFHSKEHSIQKSPFIVMSVHKKSFQTVTLISSILKLGLIFQQDTYQ